MIIAIIGRIRSGKSTVRQLIQKEAKQYNVDLEHIRFADPIYNEVEEFYKRWNIPYRKFRPLFDAIGEALAEHGDNDKVQEVFENKINLNNDLIIDDARRLTQARFLEKYDTAFIRVVSNTDTRKIRCAEGEWTDNHVSDIELNSYPEDYIINNDGTLEELKAAVKDVCKKIFSIIKS